MRTPLFIISVSLGSALATNAQTNAIKINPISLALTTVNLSFEHKVSDKASFQIGAFYTVLNYSNVLGGNRTDFSGFGITPEFRFYVVGKPRQGLFLGPYLRYQNLNATASGNDNFGNSAFYEATLNTFGGGVNLGYQWVFGGRFVLEPFLRIGFNSGSINYSGSAARKNFNFDAFYGASVLPGLNLGCAF